jgi:hypothetical protein
VAYSARRCHAHDNEYVSDNKKFAHHLNSFTRYRWQGTFNAPIPTGNVHRDFETRQQAKANIADFKKLRPALAIRYPAGIAYSRQVSCFFLAVPFR